VAVGAGTVITRASAVADDPSGQASQRGGNYGVFKSHLSDTSSIVGGLSERLFTLRALFSPASASARRPAAYPVRAVADGSENRRASLAPSSTQSHPLSISRSPEFSLVRLVFCLPDDASANRRQKLMRLTGR
jgi:hypothetical protein